MRDKVIAAIAQACQEAFGHEVAVELERPDPQFGDFSSNVAMKLAGENGGSPRDIAQAIIEKLQGSEIFVNAGVAGPGFINVTLTDEALLQALKEPPSRSMSDMRVLVEYSDPNPFKPLHAGHLYTTLIGDAIARLVENAGAETIRLNYGGDVGLHVAKSMWSIVKLLGGELPDNLSEISEADRPGWLGDRYVEGNAAYENDEQAKAEIIEVNKKVYSLHATNDRESSFAQIYWTTRDWSYKYFGQLYEHLQVHPFDRFIAESEVTALGLETVNEHLKKGVFEISDGAVIFDGEKHGLHKRVFINSDGLPTYETKDVGLSLTKWQDYHFDESIIITAHEQAEYMKVVIKAIKQFAPDPAEKTRHLTHGVLKMAGGVKMSSRAGNILLAMDMLEAARQAGQAHGGARNEEIVLAAVKYALARSRIGSDIVYDPEESVSMEGNSGPYLQYAHARARSILRKSKTSSSSPQISYLEEGERTLASKLSEYGEVIDKATLELAPHYICNYIYELAQTFNRFYENNQVIGSNREAERLSLVGIYADKLKNGLALLGIHAPDSM